MKNSTYIYLILFLLSACSLQKEKTVKETSLTKRIAEIHTKMLYHKSSPKYNLKGPVKEVQKRVWKVIGDTSSYRILGLDSYTTLHEDPLRRFNKNGYLTTEVNGYLLSTYNADRPKRIFSFYYNDDAIIDSFVIRRYHTETPFTTERVIGKSFDSTVYRFQFYADTVLYVTCRGNTTDSNAAKVSLHDSMLTYRGNVPVITKHKGTPNRYIKGDDGLYRSHVLQDSVNIQKEEYFFKNGQLEKSLRHMYLNEKVTVSNNRDTIVCEEYYNEQGDIVTYRQTKGALADSFYQKAECQYTYDSHGNWIEKATFLGAAVLTVERREITYWEE